MRSVENLDCRGRVRIVRQRVEVSRLLVYVRAFRSGCGVVWCVIFSDIRTEQQKRV